MERKEEIYRQTIYSRYTKYMSMDASTRLHQMQNRSAPKSRPSGSPSARPKPSKQTPPKKGGIGKWVFLLLFLGVVYVGYTKFLQPNTESTPLVEQTQSDNNPVSTLPASWQQAYRVTFNYGGQAVNVRSVDVRNLDQRVASIAYTVVITPKGSSRWIEDEERWKIGQAKNKKASSRVETRKVDRQIVAIVRFRTATQRLEEGAYLQVDIPQYRRNRVVREWPVKVALEVPRDRQGIAEVNGSGGL